MICYSQLQTHWFGFHLNAKDDQNASFSFYAISCKMTNLGIRDYTKTETWQFFYVSESDYFRKNCQSLFKIK